MTTRHGDLEPDLEPTGTRTRMHGMDGYSEATDGRSHTAAAFLSVT
jgi:hypothetical protein